MTWYYQIGDGSDVLKVWDHTQDPAVDSPLRTVENSGAGFRLPHDVLDVMYDEAVQAYNDAGGSVDDRALLILADAAFEQIEEYGEP